MEAEEEMPASTQKRQMGEMDRMALMGAQVDMEEGEAMQVN